MDSRSQYTNPAPPAWVLAVVEKLLVMFKDRPVKGIWSIIDMYKVIPTIIFIVFSLWGTPWRPVLAMVVAALGALMVRDIQMHNVDTDEPGGVAATDGLVMATAMIGSQIYFHFASPAFSTSYITQATAGTALSMYTVSLWRLLVYLLTPKNDPRKLPEYRLFSTAVRFNACLLFGAWLIAGSNLQSVPGSHLRDLLLGPWPVLFMALSCRYQLKYGRLFFNGTEGTETLKVLSEEAYKGDRGDALPLPIYTGDAFWVAFYRILFVADVMLPDGIAIWRWLSGDTAGIRWGQLLANAIMFAILIPLWHIVTWFNLAVAALMRREAHNRESDDEQKHKLAGSFL